MIVNMIIFFLLSNADLWLTYHGNIWNGIQYDTMQDMTMTHQYYQCWRLDMKPIFVWISLNQLLVSMIIRPLSAFGLRTPGNPQPRLVLWGSPWTSWLHLVQVGKISQTLHLAQFRPWNHARALKSSLLTSSGCDPQLFCTMRSRGRVWSKICLVASIHSRMGINRTMRISIWSQPLHIDVVASPKSELFGWVLTHKTRFLLCVGPFPNTLVNRIWVGTKAAHLWNHQTSFDASVCFRFTVRARHWQHTQIAAPGTFHGRPSDLVIGLTLPWVSRPNKCACCACYFGHVAVLTVSWRANPMYPRLWQLRAVQHIRLKPQSQRSDQ